MTTFELVRMDEGLVNVDEVVLHQLVVVANAAKDVITQIKKNLPAAAHDALDDDIYEPVIISLAEELETLNDITPEFINA